MSRIFTSGFELNSVPAGTEWADTLGPAPVLTQAIKRSGNYSMQVANLVSGSVRSMICRFASVASNGPYYARGYLYVVTYPNVNTNQVLILNNTVDNASPVVSLEIGATGILQLRDEDGVINPSTPLPLNTWHMVELLVNTTAAAGSHIVTARLNGVVFATSSTRSLSSGVSSMSVGGNLLGEAQTVGEWYWDDIAINDSTGSFQNTYPGSGSAILLLPSSTGDSNQWLNTAAGAGSSTNWQLVDEIPPNDATDMVQSVTLNDIDMYGITVPSGVPIDTINVVQVGMRFRNNTADATTSFRVRIEKTASGTVTESADIIPNSTTWKTNATTTALGYPLTLYQDPDSINWGRGTLKTMQIGVKLTAAGVNRIQVSTIWAYVDYNPLSGTTLNNYQFASASSGNTGIISVTEKIR